MTTWKESTATARDFTDILLLTSVVTEEEEVHCNIDKLHGFPVTHFSGDNVEEARYGGDRLHGEQKDARYTIRKLGDRFLEVPVAETVQRKETSLKDYKRTSEKQKSHEFSYTSPRVTGKDSEYCWDDTFG